MSFLSAEAIIGLIREGRISVSGDRLPSDLHDQDSLGNLLAIRGAKWELRVGSEYALLSEAPTGLPGDTTRRLAEGEGFSLQPGDWALIRTRESISLPGNLTALVSSKLGFTFLGISSVSAVIDPGFRGHLVVAIGNGGGHAVPIRWNDALVTLVLAHVEPALPESYSPRTQEGSLREILYSTELRDWLERITGRRLPVTGTEDAVIDGYTGGTWHGLPITELHRELDRLSQRVKRLESGLEKVLSSPEFQ